MHTNKNPGTARGNTPFWLNRLRRGVTLTAGFFALSIFLTSPDSGTKKDEPTIEVISDADPEKKSYLVEDLDFSYNLSVDCMLPTLGRNGGALSQWSNETHRPLEVALAESGEGSSPYFFIGQRAPGSNKDDAPSSGWIMGFDPKAQKYVLYDFDTRDMPASGEDGAGPKPHVVIGQKRAFGLDAIMNQIALETPEGLKLSITHDTAEPLRPLKFKITCPAPARRS